MMQKQLQQKMMEYQLMEERLKQIDQQRDFFIEKMVEIEQTKQAVEELEKNKEEDVLVPLGSGLFLPGKINKKEKMLIGIGSDIILEKDSEGINNILEQRKKILEDNLENIQNSMMQIAKEMQLLQKEIQKLLPELKAG